MKKIYGVVMCLFFSFGAYSQVGIGTENPNTHAVLELKSPGNNQGLIVPSLTTAQRTSSTFTGQLSSAENGLLVFDKEENKFYYWQNNAWQVIVSGAITGGATGPASGDLTGNYPAPQIAAGAVGSAELAGNAVVTAKLADASITDVKISSVAPSKLSAGGAVTGQVLKWNGTNWTAQADNAGGSGTVTNIATGTGLTGGPITATGTISLADNGVTTIKINDGAVTSAKILDATIATADLADGSVTDAKITSVAPSKFTAGGATNGQVLKYNGTNWTAQADNTGGSGTVTNVATGTGLTGGPITATGTISLADNGVTTIKINDGAVTSAKILDATIATADLADGSVTDAKITSVAPSKFTAGGATNGQVLKYNGTNWTAQADNTGGSGTVTNVATGTGLTGGPITATGTISLADNGVTTIKINDGAVTSVKIADGALVNADINASAAIVDTKLATISTAGKVSGNAITSGTIGGTTAVNTSGNIATTGLVTATNATTGSVITSSNSATGGYAVRGNSTSTDGGGGIFGTGTGVTVGRTTTYSYGVYGSNSFSGSYGWIGGGDGVYGNNTSGNGVLGEGYYGVYGAGSFIGVIGSAPATAGNYGIFSSGQAGGTTTWAATSDIRFKKNIQPLSNSLDNILKLRGVSYDWRTAEFPDKNFRANRDIGVIAQEILNVIPEVVVQDREGYYAVSYEKLVPVLIEAIKELEQKISRLEEQNIAMRDLKQRVEALEALLRPVSKNSVSSSQE